MANNVDRLSRNIHRIVERADIQIPPAPQFPVEAVTGQVPNRLAAVARFNADLKRWRNDRWSVDAPFVTEAELSRSITKVSDDQALLTQRFEVGLLDVSALEARVTVLETQVATIQTDITNIDARVTILESEISTAVPHTILDATVHTDSVTQTVTRGALIYGNATLKWDLLTIGPLGTYVRSDGIDAAWSSVVATEITGILPVANGGTNASSWTAGSVIFAGAGGTSLAEDNANLFWDDTNNRFGIGTIPSVKLHIKDASSPRISLWWSGASVAGGKGLITFTHNRASDSTEELIGYIQSVAEDNQFKGGFRFVARNNADIEVMRMTSAGYVGIGTTAPSVLFDLGLAGTTLGVMRMAGSTSGNVTIQPAAIAGTWTWTLPVNDGAANEFLQTDGSGVTSWSGVDLTTDITGTLPVGSGGTGSVTLTGIVQGTGTAPLTGITGIANYIPKWSATAPYLTATSNIIDDGSTIRTFSYLGVNIVPLVSLHLYRSGVNGAGAASVFLMDTDAKTVGDEIGFMFRALDSSNATVIYGGINTLIDDASVGTHDGTMLFKVAFNATFPERARLTATGNFGIGSNPDLMFAEAYQLVVGSGSGGQGLTVYAGTGSLSRMHFADGTVGDQQYRGYIAYNHAIDAFQIGTAATEAARITSTGNVGIGISPLSRLHTYVQDAVTIATTTILKLEHSSSGTPGISFGAQLLFSLKSSTTDDRDAGAINVAWTDATDATRTSVMFFRPTNSGTMATQMALSGAGGLSVGDAIATMPNGVVNVVTGFRVNLSATSGSYLRGNGTNIVLSTIQLADLPGGIVTFGNPTASVGVVAVNGVATTAMRSDAAPAINLAMAPTWTSTHRWDLGAGAPADDPFNAIYIDVPAIGAPGFSDSHAIRMTGRSDDGVDHQMGWRQWVNVTSNAGASSWVLEQNIDAGAYTAKLRVYDTGLVEIGPNGVGVTQLDTYGLGIVNTTPAASGAANQQWSGPLRWEGQGWQTGTSTSMKAEFRQYIAPVQGVAAPTVYWVMEHSVNDAAYTELMRADSTGYLRITKNALASIDTTLGQSAFGLQINNDTSATGAVTTQDAPPIIFKGAAWNSSALTSQDWRWRMLMKGVTVAGTTRSYVRLDSGTSGSNFGNPIVFTSAGGLSVGSVIESAFGVVSTQVGFQIAGGATSGTFLRGNGTNFVQGAIAASDLPGSFGGFANPTASVGLAVVNGVATTAMRSDAAPPLSVAIVPTWTGRHIWSYATLGVTPDDTKGISVVNSTAAALGAQQLSPSFAWEGKGWGTTASTSQAVRARSYILPVQASTPTGILKIETSIAGGAYTDAMWLALRSTGMVALGGPNYGLRHYISGNPDTADSQYAELFRTSAGARLTIGATGAGVFNDLVIQTGGATWITLTTTGSLRIGDNTTPTNTSWLEVAAGTTVVAAVNLVSGLLLTAPQAGAIEYDGRFQLTDTDAARRHIVQAVASTKTTAGAPYANDGYVECVINGTTLRLMTTA